MLEKCLNDARFAYPRLARDQNDTAVSCLGLLPAAQEQVQLLLAPDQWRKRGRVLCLEAALHGARAKPLP